MAKEFSVDTAFRLKDAMTGPMGKMSKSISAGFAAMGKDANKFSQLLKSVTIGSLLSKGITTAIGAFKSNISGAISYASDLIEVQNVVNTVFKGSEDAIDSWSKKAITSYGLTELQAKKFASTMGSVLGGMGISGSAQVNMSTSLSQLAGDLSSMYNITQEDAFQKLLSGMTGQTAPLKALGIVMSQDALDAFALSKGIKVAVKDMSEASKTALRFQYILENPAAKQAMGDYAKPIDSWAVSSRNATSAIQEMWGKLAAGLMPTLIRVANIVTDLARRVSAWADANKEVIAAKLDKFVDWLLKNIPKLIRDIKILGPLVLSVWGTFKLFSGAANIFNGISVAMKTYTEMTSASAVAQTALAGATNGAAMAQRALNAAALARAV
ncbi:hypothetical protein FACS189479_04500 [Spirochaetia bacterium]|nr:hypothetical protein FACS189479_04500 [Spirochaetia bacterium]